MKAQEYTLVSAPGPKSELWWLQPAYIAGILGTLVSLGAIWVPDRIYLSYWRTPKYFGMAELGVILCCIAAFCLGSLIGGYKRFHEGGPAPDWKRDLPIGLIEKAFNLMFILTFAGYAVWGAAAISRGANLEVALGVLSGNKGAATLMKDVYLVTISGVTTLTQLAISAGILGVLIGLKKGWKTVLWKFAVIMVATVIRALMNSERLAILELTIPAATLFIRLGILDSPRWSTRLWPVFRSMVVLKALPVVGVFGLFGIFGASEYFRSWSNFYAGGDQTFFEFVAFRLLGYYVTALNNGALMMHRLEPTGIPYLTFHALWRFPVISNIVKLVYPNVALDSIEMDPYMAILDRNANPEFNNGSGLLLPVMDYGFVPALLYWVVCGLICGALYRWFQQRRPAGLLLYPIVFVSVVELPRIIYWAEGRSLLPILALVPVLLLCVRYARQWRAPDLGGAVWQPSH
jgi:hypothetical protein